MKALLIGGTGNLSGAIARRLLADPEWELTLITRGQRSAEPPARAELLRCDISDEIAATRLLEGRSFDAVVDFVCFTPDQMERDIRLFQGITRQFLFVSSAVVYQTPPPSYMVREGALLNNPHWEYARNKLACEEVLTQALRKSGFPATIVRPSHTYCDTWLPFCLEGNSGSWTLIQRMLNKKPIIIPGDGSSLWVVTSNEDFAKGFIGLMGNIRAIGESVHITSDEALSWDQIHRIVADALDVPFIPCHVPSDILVTANPKLEGLLTGSRTHSIVFDNSKLKRLVPGFTANVPFERGARRAVQHLMTTPALQTFDANFDAWCDGMISIMREAHAQAAALRDRGGFAPSTV